MMARSGNLAPQTTTEYVKIQHGGSTLNWDARWRAIHELSDPPFRVHESMAVDLEIGPHDRVLDAGCAGGATLLELRRLFPEAQLTGVDIDDLFVVTQSVLEKYSLRGINFLGASAEALPFFDDSFDKAYMAYVLYYLDNPALGLAELRRVVRFGGKIGIATIDADNKPKHRAFEQLMAERLGATPPKVPAAPFNSATAATTLPQYFGLVESQPALAAMRVRTPEQVDVYLDSLWTMRTARDEPYPALSEWEDVLQTVVRKHIEETIDQEGEFVDQLRHTYFVCTNVRVAQ